MPEYGAVTTMTSRELNQDTGRAKRAASAGPVFITERGEMRFVLLNMSDYHQLTGKGQSLADLLGDHPGVDVNLELPERRAWEDRRVPDFSDDPG